MANGIKNGNFLRVLFTADMHDRILPYKAVRNGRITMIGGYARLKTMIDRYRTESCVVLDGGDFSMGSLFNGIYSSTAPDLSLLGMMGYDAVTIGNHEFDYGVDAFASMLRHAENPPQILCANIEFTDDSDSRALKEALDARGCLPYMIRDIGGFKVGITGMMGHESVGDIAYPGSVTFTKEKKALSRTISEMKNKGCEFTIVLSHGGMNDDPDKAEDLQLVESIDGVDVLISAHSHTALKRPVVKNDTVICSCGCNCEYLGLLDINMIDGTVLRYELIPVDDSYAENAEINARIEDYKEIVQKDFLDAYGLKFDDVLCTSDICLDDLHDDNYHFGNYNIADLVTDSYVHAAVEAGCGENVIGISASGIIRDTIYAGDVTLPDAYNIVPLGRSSDGVIGYPLIATKLSGIELRELCEIDASLGRMRADSQLFFSGLRYTYSDKRAFMNRVIDVFTKDEKGAWKPVRDDKTYTVVCNQYMAIMMPQITSKSYGFLKIQVKDENGAKTNDLDKLLLKDKNGNTVREWTAFVDFLLSFRGKLPEAYLAARPCKIEEMNLNPKTYLKHPSKFGKLIYGAGAVAAGALVIAGSALASEIFSNRRGR